MSAATKAVGVVLIVLAVLILLAALVLIGSEETFVPAAVGDRTQSGLVYAGAGVAFLAIGVVLLLLKPKRRVTPDAPPQPQRQAVEIKRTEMNVGRPEPTTGASAGSSSLDDEIDEMTRQLSRLKVQYGMGEISKESFRRLRDELEKEKAELELRRVEEERA